MHERVERQKFLLPRLSTIQAQPFLRNLFGLSFTQGGGLMGLALGYFRVAPPGRQKTAAPS